MIKLKDGLEIKALLLKKGITLDDIARDFDLHKSTISRYFSNELNMSAKFLFNLPDYSKLNIYLFVKQEDGSPVKQYRIKEKPTKPVTS